LPERCLFPAGFAIARYFHIAENERRTKPNMPLVLWSKITRLFKFNSLAVLVKLFAFLHFIKQAMKKEN